MKKGQDIKFSPEYPEQNEPALDAVTISQAYNLLEQAEIKGCDWLLRGSNSVLLVTLANDGREFKAVYKPRQGEAPLWDFPDGTLYRREFAAFLLSRALEWYLVPPTVIRHGPYGIGSMQWFITTVNEPGIFSPIIGDLSVLKQVAIFDYLANNADRKAGHFLQGKDGKLWVVDHGLTFNAVPKLRTVLWDFSGQAVPENLLADVKMLRDKLGHEKQLRQSFLQLLEESEVEALEFRINKLIENPVFVYPGPHRSVPWPPV